MAWQQSPTHPLEQKKVAESHAVGLLRFGPGFSDPKRCERSHVLYVVQGTLELELEHGVERLAQGEACVLPRGSWHRARNPGDEPVLVFAVSDLELG
jgi:quercetin dioxygenase-like cupin family protein